MAKGLSGQRKLGSVALDGWPHANPTNPNQFVVSEIFKNALARYFTRNHFASVGEICHSKSKDVHVVLVRPKRG
jgi:hypothetical protein